MRQTARSVALEAIRRVTDEGAYSTIVIPGALRRSRLDERDRAFATGLAFGTIRHLLAIDWALDRVASRPVARMSPSARTVVRLGAYQVLFTDVAPHAAVGETVGLAGDRERGFVNAVLRRLAAEPHGLARRRARRRRRDPTDWRRGGERARKLLPAHEVEPAAGAFGLPAWLCLRANPRRRRAGAPRAGAPRRGVSALPPSMLPASCSTEATRSFLPGYEEGWFAVQDQASAVRRPEPSTPDRAIASLDALCRAGREDDLCGGARRGRGPRRRRRPACRPSRSDRAERAATRPFIRSCSRRTPPHRLCVDPFDPVLVDAPCTGFGRGPPAPRAALARSEARPGGLARQQVAIVSAAGRPPPPGRAPRLLRLHVPPGRDLRGRRRERPPSPRLRAALDRRAPTGRPPPVACGHIAHGTRRYVLRGVPSGSR